MQFSCMFHRSTTQSDSILVKLTNCGAWLPQRNQYPSYCKLIRGRERERETVPRLERRAAADAWTCILNCVPSSRIAAPRSMSSPLLMVCKKTGCCRSLAANHWSSATQPQSQGSYPPDWLTVCLQANEPNDQWRAVTIKKLKVLP